MYKRYTVFLSSTFKDLQAERREVIQSLLELDCIPVGMELFPAADDDAWTFIKKAIDDSDYYVVIVGGRYGTVDDEKGISYTEKEYDYAAAQGIPTIAFLHEAPGSIPVEKSELDEVARLKLDAFRKKAERRLCKYWRTPVDLGSKVSRSCTQLIKNNPTVGWVRASRTEGRLESLTTGGDGELLRPDEAARAGRMETSAEAVDVLTSQREEDSGPPPGGHKPLTARAIGGLVQPRLFRIGLFVVIGFFGGFTIRHVWPKEDLQWTKTASARTVRRLQSLEKESERSTLAAQKLVEEFEASESEISQEKERIPRAEVALAEARGNEQVVEEERRIGELRALWELVHHLRKIVAMREVSTTQQEHAFRALKEALRAESEQVNVLTREVARLTNAMPVDATSGDTEDGPPT